MHNDEMTDATKLAPCPLCGDLMKVTNAGTFGHTDSNAECLLAKYAWGDEPQFVAAWNQRALTTHPGHALAGEITVEDHREPRPHGHTSWHEVRENGRYLCSCCERQDADRIAAALSTSGEASPSDGAAGESEPFDDGSLIGDRRHRQGHGSLVTSDNPITPQEWQPIETAPANTPVRVKVGIGMSFIARLVPDSSMNADEESCDQWQAEYEGEHPECWSDGGCWENNVDEVASMQPIAWQPAPPALASSEQGEG